MSPRVSIIVPNYNHARYLPDRLLSIEQQTYQDFEIILLDDCSTDNSRDLIFNYASNPKVSQCILNEKNSGSPFIQWVRGISLAQGEWIWIAESDDLADPMFLQSMLEATEKNPSAGLAYCHLRWIDSQGNLISEDESNKRLTRFYTGSNFTLQKLLYTTTIFNVSSCIFKRKAFQEIDYTALTTMKCSGDYWLYVQLSQITDVLELGDVLSSFRRHEGSTSKQLTKVGVACIEDLYVLDFICHKYAVSQTQYSKNWARILASYKLPWRIQLDIWKRYFKKHCLIVFWSILYRFSALLKG